MTSPPETWALLLLHLPKTLLALPSPQSKAEHCVSTGYQAGVAQLLVSCELNKSLILGDFLGKVAFLTLEE